MSKKESDAQDKILSYLEQQNRPYSTNDILLNLHKEFGKTAVQKALDQLVANGSVKEKTYGKQKIYFIDQSRFPPLDEGELKAMDSEINDLNEAIKQRKAELQESETRLKQLCSSMTTEEANKKKRELEDEVHRLQERLSSLQGNTVLIPAEQQEKAKHQHEKMVKEWRKRKRIALDILDAIMEGYPKSKKELFEEIGIETDEDAGVILPKT